MHALSSQPNDVYRRIELDARVEGADGVGLTKLCLEAALTELGRAQRADVNNDHFARTNALSRAASSVAGLCAGISRNNPMREPLLQIYGAGEMAIRACISNYKSDVLKRVGKDLDDILALL